MQTKVDTEASKFTLNLKDVPDKTLVEAEDGTIYYRMIHNKEYLVFNSKFENGNIGWDAPNTSGVKVRLFHGKITLEQ